LYSIKGEQVDAFLEQKDFRLGTTPFSSKKGSRTTFIARAVPWTKKVSVPKNICKKGD